MTRRDGWKKPRHPRSPFRSLTIAALALSVGGCGFHRTSGGFVTRLDTSVPEYLHPALDRFQSALVSRTGQQVHRDGEQMKLFAAAFGAMVHNYVDPVDPKALIDAAITGVEKTPATPTPGLDLLADAGISAMVSAVDPGGDYLEPDLYAEAKSDRRGRSGGVGLEITTRDGVITIVFPLEGGPAARAGLRPEDQLLAIDHMSTEGIKLTRAARALRGSVGSEVVLTVRRPSSGEVLTPRLTREVISLREVAFERLNEGHGYLRISQFGARTDATVRDALDSLQKEGAIEGIVLDLRGNHGGILTQAVKIADLFLDAGTIVRMEGRGPDNWESYHARRDGRWGVVPLVILVDHETAAGGEIVAAALQGNGRGAVIVGTRTKGHGTVQTLVTIEDRAVLRLTTSRAYSPAGAAIDLGVAPDVVIDAHDRRGTPSTHETARDPMVAAAVRVLSDRKPTDAKDQ